MGNGRLDETQAEIKISGENINNLRYADDTTLMAENEEALKSLLVKTKEESEKAALILSIQKTKIMASGPNTSWQIDRQTMEIVILESKKIKSISIVSPLHFKNKWNITYKDGCNYSVPHISSILIQFLYTLNT